MKNAPENVFPHKPVHGESGGLIRLLDPEIMHGRFDSDETMRPMALIDGLRMDRTAFPVVTTDPPSDAKAYWKTKFMGERLTALEFTRQVFYGYDLATTRLQRILEVTKYP